MPISFNPPVHPDFGIDRQYKPKVLMAQFGDGYSQRAADGINNMPVMIDAIWTNVTSAEKTAIIAFLEARRGFEGFSYTYVDESSPKVYVCPEWSYIHNDVGGYTINAQFMQVYDLG